MVQYKVGGSVLYSMQGGRVYGSSIYADYFFRKANLPKNSECFFSFVNNETLWTI